MATLPHLVVRVVVTFLDKFMPLFFWGPLDDWMEQPKYTTTAAAFKNLSLLNDSCERVLAQIIHTNEKMTKTESFFQKHRRMYELKTKKDLKKLCWYFKFFVHSKLLYDPILRFGVFYLSILFRVYYLYSRICIAEFVYYAIVLLFRLISIICVFKNLLWQYYIILWLCTFWYLDCICIMRARLAGKGVVI